MIADAVLLNDWHPVAKSTDLAEAAVVPARLLGEDLVLWRVHGKAMAWQDLCVHRGSRLSLGRLDGDLLQCAYHGWTYNELGECVRFPAHPDQKPPSKARVVTYACREAYGLIWACLGTPGDVPAFNEWEDGAFRKVACGPYRYRASGTRAIENFLDVAHLPVLHGGTLGDPAHAEIGEYQVREDGEGIEARDIEVWQPDPDGTGVGKNVSYTYRVMRPMTAYLAKDTDEGRLAIFASVCPVSELESVAWFWLAMNYGEEVEEGDLVAFQDRITRQDIAVVESQRPERLPLDLQAELHLRSDRVAVAYRRWLRRLGVTFGTA